jgi:hypothetical protein
MAVKAKVIRTARFFLVIEVDITNPKLTVGKLVTELPQWFGGVQQPGYTIKPVTTLVPVAEGEGG